MRLGIDLDGVVANFTKGWMKFYNRDFGSSLTVEQSRRWNDLVDLTHFRDMDEFWAWSESLDGHSVFWYLEPFPGAIEALQGLDQAGHSIIVLTTKPAFAVADTYEWIDRHHLPADEIHILEKKWEIECDVYLDDAPHVLYGLATNRRDRTICRYVRPWNRALPGVIDVEDFAEFSDVVGGLANDPFLPA